MRKKYIALHTDIPLRTLDTTVDAELQDLINLCFQTDLRDILALNPERTSLVQELFQGLRQRLEDFVRSQGEHRSALERQISELRREIDSVVSEGPSTPVPDAERQEQIQSELRRLQDLRRQLSNQLAETTDITREMNRFFQRVEAWPKMAEARAAVATDWLRDTWRKRNDFGRMLAYFELYASHPAIGKDVLPDYLTRIFYGFQSADFPNIPDPGQEKKIMQDKMLRYFYGLGHLLHYEVSTVFLEEIASQMGADKHSTIPDPVKQMLKRRNEAHHNSVRFAGRLDEGRKKMATLKGVKLPEVYRQLPDWRTLEGNVNETLKVISERYFVLAVFERFFQAFWNYRQDDSHVKIEERAKYRQQQLPLFRALIDAFLHLVKAQIEQDFNDYNVRVRKVGYQTVIQQNNRRQIVLTSQLAVLEQQIGKGRQMLLPEVTLKQPSSRPLSELKADLAAKQGQLELLADSNLLAEYDFQMAQIRTSLGSKAANQEGYFAEQVSGRAAMTSTDRLISQRVSRPDGTQLTAWTELRAAEVYTIRNSSNIVVRVSFSRGAIEDMPQEHRLRFFRALQKGLVAPSGQNGIKRTNTLGVYEIKAYGVDLRVYGTNEIDSIYFNVVENKKFI